MNSAKLWNWDDLSERLQVGIPTLRKWFFQRRIPAVRLGGGRRALVRFIPAEIEKWIEQQRTGGGK